MPDKTPEQRFGITLDPELTTNFLGRFNAEEIVDEFLWPMLGQFVPGADDPRLSYENGIKPSVEVSFVRKLRDPTSNDLIIARAGAEITEPIDDEVESLAGEVYILEKTSPDNLLGALMLDAYGVNPEGERDDDESDQRLSFDSSDIESLDNAVQELMDEDEDDDEDEEVERLAFQTYAAVLGSYIKLGTKPEDIGRFSGVAYEFDADGLVSEWHVTQLEYEFTLSFVRPGRKNIKMFDPHDLTIFSQIGKILGQPKRQAKRMKDLVLNPTKIADINEML